MKLTRKESLQRRHRRIRKDVSGSTERPRLAVFRSHQHIYAQVIDDVEQHTIVAASSLEPELKLRCILFPLSNNTLTNYLFSDLKL